MKLTRPLISSVICATLSSLSYGAEKEPGKPLTAEEMIITGIRMEQPLVLETDPKAPRQPLPAQDGADYLKTIPGFSVIRKGGTSGDPVFRGMAGSRLSLLLDGDVVLGGCGSRMDPPTAYVFPETYDRIRLIKGPQTVLYGPGNSAGVVLFERDHKRMAEPGWKFHGSLLGASFNRDDEVLDFTGGTPDFYVRGMGSHSQQDNYSDGDGNEFHSQYDRWNTSLALGWTPSDDVTLELSGSKSDAEAAYADRSMDGAKFARENVNLKLILENLSPLVKKLETQIYYNYVDHVMDNYSLRAPTSMGMGMAMGMNIGMDMLMASNPDRETQGAHILATLTPTESAQLAIGVDTQANEHTNRSSMNQAMMRYQDAARVEDAHFQQVGVFGEWTQYLSQTQRLIGGLRVDGWNAEDKRSTVSAGTAMSNPHLGEKREETLTSGFLRYEKDVKPFTLYAGLGHNKRFPDYWEFIGRESITAITAFEVEPEATTQLDIGAIYSKDRIKASASVYYNTINDYLMIQTGVVKPADMGATRMASVTRNIDATTWGMESELSYAFTHNWRVETSLATVRGSNDTDHTSLAQLPPVELRVGVTYERTNWSAGAFWRAVDEQNRVDKGKGNIAGQDIGPSASFDVVSLNLGWRVSRDLLITSGIDNLFDKNYAEHISKAGAMIAGYDQTTRVNEPGRNVWLKMQLSYE